MNTSHGSTTITNRIRRSTTATAAALALTLLAGACGTDSPATRSEVAPAPAFRTPLPAYQIVQQEIERARGAQEARIALGPTPAYIQVEREIESALMEIGRPQPSAAELVQQAIDRAETELAVARARADGQSVASASVQIENEIDRALAEQQAERELAELPAYRQVELAIEHAAQHG